MSKKIDTLSFLKEGEIIQLVLHRHWIVLFFKSLYIAFLGISTIIFLVFQTKITSLVGGTLFWFILTLYWIVFLVFIFFSWIQDEIRFLIITNQRVFSISQFHFFSYKINECPLYQIQEVQAYKIGILATIFGYGNIKITTASTYSDINIGYIPSAINEASQINNIIKIHTQKK